MRNNNRHCEEPKETCHPRNLLSGIQARLNLCLDSRFRGNDNGVKFLIALLMFVGTFQVNYCFAEEKGTNMTDKNIYSFKETTIDGEVKDLSEYKGKALLIVNTASRCGFTPQYKSLEALYEKYKDRGFEILGFPANNFMGQEPGTDKEIKEFCSLKFHVTFPMFSKISVKGKDIDPLYSYLTKESGFDGDISWNFNKFLVNGEGKVIARFDSRTDPLSDKLTSQLESLLPKK